EPFARELSLGSFACASLESCRWAARALKSSDIHSPTMAVMPVGSLREERMAARFAYRSCVRRMLLFAALPLVALCARADEGPDMSGAELYRVFCASCHGKEARGDGLVAETLKPTVPDLTRI